jgi:PAS domain S-box-containing protein
MHETRLGYGIVGGMLLEGREHGSQTAAQALRILAGEEISQISVENSRSRPVFDHNVLHRFNISEKLLPTDSVIINRPASFWRQYRTIWVPGVVIIGILVMSTVLLMRTVMRMHIAEKSLRKSEERFLLAMKASNDGLFDWNLETNHIYYSPAWKNMLGYEDHELPNDFSIWEKTIDPEDVQKSWELQQKLISKQIDRFVLEFKMKHKDGHWVDILSRAEAIFNDSGKAVRIVGTHVDITERKRAEEVLRRNEKDLRESQRIAHVGSWRLDVATNQVVWTEELYNMFGFDPSLPPPPYTEHMKLFTPESWERLSTALARTMDTGIPYTLELETLRKDRSNGWMWVQGEVEVDSAGKTVELWGAAQDITERKQAEEEKEKLQTQLLQAQKIESVGRLAGGVAHDFNNMLGVILGHTELALVQTDENHDLYADLKEIQNAATRSADITKQLLAFARKQTISPRQLDLNDTVESMLNMLRRLIREDIDLSWLPARQLWPVKMDPTQIDQILANLCINARDAISGAGKLTIETGRKSFDEEYCKEHSGFIPGDFVLLAVSDNGCGMDNDTQKNLFEPFFTTKDVGKGTGLGLATIYGIVKQNNGFINVYSEPGQGSTFKIYLPRLVVDEDTDKAVPEKKSTPGGTETILLVEDEPSILRMTRMMLESKGYTLLSAATPAEAINTANAYVGKIHLLMTDVVMPEMNGRDLAEKVTAIYPEIKQLFMSGYTANVIAHQGVLDDGVAFIPKPFSMADMTVKIREILDKTSDENQG